MGQQNLAAGQGPELVLPWLAADAAAVESPAGVHELMGLTLQFTHRAYQLARIGWCLADWQLDWPAAASGQLLSHPDVLSQQAGLLRDGEPLAAVYEAAMTDAFAALTQQAVLGHACGQGLGSSTKLPAAAVAADAAPHCGGGASLQACSGTWPGSELGAAAAALLRSQEAPGNCGPKLGLLREGEGVG